MVSKSGISFSKGPPFSGEPCLFWGVYSPSLISWNKAPGYARIVFSEEIFEKQELHSLLKGYVSGL